MAQMKQPEKQYEKSFKDSWDILGSGWKPKNGSAGANLVINEPTTLQKGDRLQLFATRTKKEPTSPDYVLCKAKA